MKKLQFDVLHSSPGRVLLCVMLPLLGVKKEDVRSMRLLGSDQSVGISTSWVHSDYPEILFADLGPDPVLPDPVDTVLEVRLKG